MLACVFFFQAEDGIRDVAVTGVQTCALPISVTLGNSGRDPRSGCHRAKMADRAGTRQERARGTGPQPGKRGAFADRKSTRLNSSHGYISYAVFCLKKNNKIDRTPGQLHHMPRAILWG